eukprot:jgi/Astpho2/6656/fgenesh1_pg.00101_%23_45_t
MTAQKLPGQRPATAAAGAGTLSGTMMSSALGRASGSAAWSEMRPGSAPPSSRAGGSQQPRTTSFSSRGGLSPGLEPAASSATSGRPTLVESGRARSQAWHVRPGRSAAFLSLTRDAAQARARPHSAAEHLQPGQYEARDHLARPRSASPVLFSRQIDRAAAGQEVHRERVGRTVGPGMHFLHGAPSNMYGHDVLAGHAKCSQQPPFERQMGHFGQSPDLMEGVMLEDWPSGHVDAFCICISKRAVLPRTAAACVPPRPATALARHRTPPTVPLAGPEMQKAVELLPTPRAVVPLWAEMVEHHTPTELAFACDQEGRPLTDEQGRPLMNAILGHDGEWWAEELTPSSSPARPKSRSALPMRRQAVAPARAPATPDLSIAGIRVRSQSRATIGAQASHVANRDARRSFSAAPPMDAEGLTRSVWPLPIGAEASADGADGVDWHRSVLRVVGGRFHSVTREGAFQGTRVAILAGFNAASSLQRPDVASSRRLAKLQPSGLDLQYAPNMLAQGHRPRSPTWSLPPNRYAINREAAARRNELQEAALRMRDSSAWQQEWRRWVGAARRQHVQRLGGLSPNSSWLQRQGVVEHQRRLRNNQL